MMERKRPPQSERSLQEFKEFRERAEKRAAAHKAFWAEQKKKNQIELARIEKLLQDPEKLHVKYRRFWKERSDQLKELLKHG